MVNPEIYTVSLGQRFHPFKIEKTEWPNVWREAFSLLFPPYSYENHTPEIFFDLELTNTVSEEVTNILNFPHKRLRGMIREGNGLYQLTEFFPFEPKFGYRVDKRDFTAEARGKKLKELNKKAEKIKLKDRLSFQPFIVDMMLENLELDNAKRGTTQEKEIERRMESYMQLSERVRPYLESLRCQVFVAGQAYEAMPDLSSGFVSLRGIRLIFDWFYPLDTGPLASIGIQWPQDSGQWLALPMDPQKLATLEMRFSETNHLGGV